MAGSRAVALVLSGGGNRGAVQVGALQALLEAGLRPDVLVGTSAGAINAAGLALDPTPEGLQQLARAWQACRRENVYPGGRLRALIHLLLTGRSLYPSGPLHRFLARYLDPQGTLTFGSLEGPRLYIPAVRLRDGALHVFGDDPGEPVLDAVMASTAVPVLFPPWEWGGEQWIDGGALADVPVQVALERGVTEVHAVHVMGRPAWERPVRRVGEVLERTASAVLQQQIRRDLHDVGGRRVRFRYYRLDAFPELPYWDYAHAEELILHGYRQTLEILKRQSRRPEAGGLLSKGKRLLQELAARLRAG